MRTKKKERERKNCGKVKTRKAANEVKREEEKNK